MELITGKAVQYIAESLNKEKETVMGFGNQVEKNVIYTKDFINKIKRMEKGFTNGPMGQFTKDFL